MALKDKWHGCYEDGWAGIIVPEAFGHPAKMSYNLTRRIFKHALSEGWIKPGDTVVDPFGGIGSTGLIGAALGLRVICVELEEKFCRMTTGYDCPGMSKKEWVRWFGRFDRNTEICPACQSNIPGRYEKNSHIIPSQEPHRYVGNFEKNRRIFECQHFGHAYQPVMLQGDSRNLSEILSKADLIVSSPPFSERQPPADGRPLDGRKNERYELRKHRKDTYGATPGQLGAMKPGSVDAVVSSPPWQKQEGSMQSRKFRDAEKSAQMLADRCAAGETKGHYATPAARKRAMDKANNQDYGQTPGNLANLKPGHVDSIISSPPWEGSVGGGGDQLQYTAGLLPGESRRGKVGKGDLHHYNENNANNLGNSQGETFWGAAKQIVKQCHQILRPGGVAIWVVKDFVRDKKRVDFTGEWQWMCEQLGFKTLHIHHAMLYKEDQTMTFEWGKPIRKEDVSFFRRNVHNKGAWRNYWGALSRKKQHRWLAKTAKRLGLTKYKKLLLKAQEAVFRHMGEVHWEWNEDIRIDYEVVLCTRKGK